MSGLPRGWVEAHVGDISSVQLGKMLDKLKNQGLPMPYLRNVNVRWGEFDLNDLAVMRFTQAEAQIFDVLPGDVFVCEGGEPGRAAVWKAGDSALLYQKALHRIRSFGNCESEWIALFLRLSTWTGDLSEALTGTTIKHLPRENLLKVALPVPPLPEQRRIVAKIDSLSARSKRAREELGRIEKLSEAARIAILDQEFMPGSSAVPDRRCTLGELTAPDSPICYGVVQPGEVLDVGIPLIRVCDLKGRAVYWGNLRFVDAAIDQEYSRSRVLDGDVLVSLVGTIGRVAVVEGAPRQCNIARAIARIRVKKDKCDPLWLGYLLSSSSMQEKMASDTREVARKTLNLSLLRALTIDLPSLDRQREIVRRIEAAFARINRLAAEAESARKLLDRLDQAVLAKAFRGELAPQDPADEPASVLLDRIRAERAAKGTVTKGRRGRPRKPTA